MNNRREHRIIVYNNLYKKYLRFMKKTSVQRTRNRLLKSTNSELSKEIIRLKEEIRKSMSINSNLKTEIHDLTIDTRHLMDDNKGLYNTLTTLHKDTKAFEKRISNLLNSSDPEIQSFETQKVNGIKNPKDVHQQLPETNYHRYNFKDFIYIQDLSPIMEENIEVNKKLIKPSDVTRRLGHRAKLTHADKCSENVEVNGSVFDEAAETNTVNCSPSSARVQNFSKEIKNVGKPSMIVEEEIIPNIVGVYCKELLSSPSESNESISMNVDESILSSSLLNHSESRTIPMFKNENDGLSPIPIIEIVPPSDSDNTLNEKEENILNENDESTLNETDQKDFRSTLFVNVFPRRRMINNRSSSSLGSAVEESSGEQNSTNIEKENLSPRVSTNSLKNDPEQSNIITIRSDSFLKNNLTINHENNSGLASEISQQEESIIGKTCSDIRHGVKTVAAGGNARDGSNMEMSLILETKEAQSSKKSTLDTDSKSTLEKRSEIKKLSRTADRNSVNSSKHVTPGRKSSEDSKKALRPKKALNLAESPVKKTHQKRKQKLDKAVK
ncbi:unnamed protein product [Nezara viridula]|uniref:Uncharacterized protein n=1 Tax=Nezara viridula TaxID=85310 RepID=A0A9P0HQ27_NEZVI|nr:unnamed protein product [Nezara viridula]